MVQKSLLTLSAVFGQICPPLTSWDCIWVNPTSKSPTRRKVSLTLLVIMLQKREAVGQKPMGGVCTGITECVIVSWCQTFTERHNCEPTGRCLTFTGQQKVGETIAPGDPLAAHGHDC